MYNYSKVIAATWGNIPSVADIHQDLEIAKAFKVILLEG
jgi:hypothetical protein